MKIVAIVQARMGSTRLPGKVMMDLLGEPVLVRDVNRLRRSKLLDEVVIATTTQPADDHIVSLCKERGWPYFRGDENDVLDRYYEQQMLGYNCRMTDIQAALGLNQLKRLEEYVIQRNALADRYNHELKELPLQLPTIDNDNHSVCHIYLIRLIAERINKSHRKIFEELRKNGVGVNLHYMPVHLQPYYRNLGFMEGQFPEAERHCREAITLPLYPKMNPDVQSEVISTIFEVIEK